MNQEKKRLLGVDLYRKVAAYAIIPVHSDDENWEVPIDPWAVILGLSL